MQRRDFLKTMGAGLLIWQTPLVTAIPHKPKKVIWVMLRGAMDSLHAVVPLFDKSLIAHRKTLVTPIAKMLLPLDRGFGLHPDLKFFHQLYLKKQFSPVIAVATPYRERSHFDAQDILESGKNPIDHESGWLARAIAEYRGDGLAVARSVPISLRGQGNIRTWYPSNLPDSGADIYSHLMKLYNHDERLSKRLQQTMDTQNLVGEMQTKRRSKLPQLAKACATLMKADGGPNCAMLEMGGWDTHNNQVNRLSNQFEQLDSAMQTLRTELASDWKDTLVIIGTEFGRTVAVNGTRGSDHGTASALFLAGGNMGGDSIKGGKVLGKWPGLNQEELYEGRDLKPTSNSFDWIATALKQHWDLSETQIQRIFPSR